MFNKVSLLVVGMWVSLVFIPLALGVTLSSFVAGATRQWGHAFIVWQLFWWLLVSIVLGVVTYYLARLVMLRIEDKYVLSLAVWGTVGGLIALLVGLGISIAVIVTGHVPSAPVPLYWPLPVGAGLMALGVCAGAEHDVISGARDWHRKMEAREDQERIEREQLKRWRQMPALEKLEFEDRFLEALYSATAGDTGSVSLEVVWSRLGHEFGPDAAAHALRVWRERKCIELKTASEGKLTDVTELLATTDGLKQAFLSLTASGRDLYLWAKDHGLPIHVEYRKLGEARVGDTYNVGAAGAVGPWASASNVIINWSYQVWQSLPNHDTELLAAELASLRAALEAQAPDAEQDHATVAVHAAQLAAKEGDGPTALSHLASVGKWVLRVATEIGKDVAVAAIKAAMGIG